MSIYILNIIYILYLYIEYNIYTELVTYFSFKNHFIDI